MEIGKRRINVQTIRKLADGEGITLRNGRPVKYKTGWQVGIQGIKVKTAEEVSRILHSDLGRKGNVGIWYYGGIYYIDVSKRIATKKNALIIGKLMNQQSIYGWAPRKAGQLVWC
jgi:hypothetical protein